MTATDLEWMRYHAASARALYLQADVYEAEADAAEIAPYAPAEARAARAAEHREAAARFRLLAADAAAAALDLGEAVAGVCTATT